MVINWKLSQCIYPFFAVPPTKVQLKIEEVNAPTEYSVKMGTKENPKEVAVDCVAEEARPPPQFQWFLGNDELKVSTVVSIFWQLTYLYHNVTQIRHVL